MMLNKRVSVCLLLCVALVGACALSSTAAVGAEDDAASRQLISEGLGLGSVYVWHSMLDDVVAIYGKDYELVPHGEQTDEIRYAQLGLSFYYCRADQQKRIFDIECRAPFNGFTARGIVLGESTLRDVFKAYGQTEAHTNANDEAASVYEYPGIKFHVERKGPQADNPKRLLSRKIMAIDIITSRSGADCLESNLK
ncbi:MAG TPA: hypothetical protein VE775_01890 [Pyrinomonadaceae bacterium]|nr:hypothetical protein [Pyrinomonadaceae bacterium]